MARERHARIVDLIRYLKDIDDHEERPIVIPIEGITTAVPAAPAAITIPVPEDRHLYIHRVTGFVDCQADELIAAPATPFANIASLVTVQVMIDELPLFWTGALGVTTINMAQICGTGLNPNNNGMEMKPVMYHVRPKVSIVTTFGLLAGFPAAIRRMGIALHVLVLKNPGSGM